MVIPAKIDLSLHQGVKFYHNINISGDLSLKSFVCKVETRDRQDVVEMTVTKSGNDILIELTAEQTKLLEAGMKYPYDIIQVDSISGDYEKVVIEGTISVLRSKTADLS
jgi:hypothetical protein